MFYQWVRQGISLSSSFSKTFIRVHMVWCMILRLSIEVYWAHNGPTLPFGPFFAWDRDQAKLRTTVLVHISRGGPEEDVSIELLRRYAPFTGRDGTKTTSRPNFSYKHRLSRVERATCLLFLNYILVYECTAKRHLFLHRFVQTYRVCCFERSREYFVDLIPRKSYNVDGADEWREWEY